MGGHSADRQESSNVDIGNGDGLRRIQAGERVRVQQPEHNWHLRLRRVLQHVIQVGRTRGNSSWGCTHSEEKSCIRSTMTNISPVISRYLYQDWKGLQRWLIAEK